MLINDKEKYVNSLAVLWNKVFGDDEDYIKLFFKDAYYDCECFAEIVDDEVVSAFYLLGCIIKLDGKIYNGRYLYAAATLPEYRGKGLMAKLIGEAEAYLKAQNIDFIALVPADDGLYDYYGRFGFKEAMYKYRYTLINQVSTMRSYREITDSDEFVEIRNSLDSDMLIYNDICNKYAFDCLRFAGTRVFYLKNNAYYIEGEELLCSYEETAINLINNLCGESAVYTNLNIDSAEKIRNGMILSLKVELKFKDIYMNIALD
jgi:GNAT superfamily N-acetyltransferase